MKVVLSSVITVLSLTGCIVTDDEFERTIIDGEYVSNDKNMNPIQSFYSFDILSKRI